MHSWRKSIETYKQPLVQSWWYRKEDSYHRWNGKTKCWAAAHGKSVVFCVLYYVKVNESELFILLEELKVSTWLMLSILLLFFTSKSSSIFLWALLIWISSLKNYVSVAKRKCFLFQEKKIIMEWRSWLVYLWSRNLNSFLFMIFLDNAFFIIHISSFLEAVCKQLVHDFSEI